MLDSFFNLQNGEISQPPGKSHQVGAMVHKTGYMINGSVSTHPQWKKKA